MTRTPARRTSGRVRLRARPTIVEWKVRTKLKRMACMKRPPIRGWQQTGHPSAVRRLALDQLAAKPVVIPGLHDSADQLAEHPAKMEFAERNEAIEALLL